MKQFKVLLMIFFSLLALASCTSMGTRVASKATDSRWSSTDQKIEYYQVEDSTGMGKILVNGEETTVAFALSRTGQITFYDHAPSYLNNEDCFLEATYNAQKKSTFTYDENQLELVVIENNTNDVSFDNLSIDIYRYKLDEKYYKPRYMSNYWKNSSYDISIDSDIKAFFSNKYLGSIEYNDLDISIYLKYDDENTFSIYKETNDELIISGLYVYDKENKTLNLTIKTGSIYNIGSQIDLSIKYKF